MSGQSTVGLDQVVLDGLERGIPLTPEADPLAGPFVEGGRARDIVELCARLELPAMFLDRTGHVLHVSAPAQAYLGTDLSVEAGELRSRVPAADAVLKKLIDTTIRSLESRANRRTAQLDDSLAESATVTTITYPNTSPYQFLQAVLLVGSGPHLNDKLTLVEDVLNQG